MSSNATTLHFLVQSCALSQLFFCRRVSFCRQQKLIIVHPSIWSILAWGEVFRMSKLEDRATEKCLSEFFMVCLCIPFVYRSNRSRQLSGGQKSKTIASGFVLVLQGCRERLVWGRKKHQFTGTGARQTDSFVSRCMSQEWLFVQMLS